MLILAIALTVVTGCEAIAPQSLVNSKPTFHQQRRPTNDTGDKDLWLADFGGPIDVESASHITINMNTEHLDWYQPDCDKGVRGACQDKIQFENIRTNTVFEGGSPDLLYVTSSNIDAGEQFNFSDADSDFDNAKQAIRTGRFHMRVCCDGDSYTVDYIEVYVNYK